ncbi:tyrosine-type recombinase/integrase [Mesorhizobium sp. M0140]|uniref:tyrosine-type recombinase/integrase n=1 Tax=Mesorhizobium sp. M0140 TaxID=2956893 RepID=UPI00333872FA
MRERVSMTRAPTIRHITAIHLLQSGVDISVVALWLSHESPATTHMYLQAELVMKERLVPAAANDASQGRVSPARSFMQFLLSLYNYAQFASWKRSGKPMVIGSCPGELRIIIGCA